jgi:hypothetical protein
VQCRSCRCHPISAKSKSIKKYTYQVAVWLIATHVVPSESIGNAEAGVVGFFKFTADSFAQRVLSITLIICKNAIRSQHELFTDPTGLSHLVCYHMTSCCTWSLRTSIVVDERPNATECGQNVATVPHERFHANGQGLILQY